MLVKSNLLRLGLISALAVSMTMPGASIAQSNSAKSYGSSASLSKNGQVSTNRDITPASATLKKGLRALDKGDMPTALAARRALRAGTLERKIMAWAIAMDGRVDDAMLLSQISQDLSHWPGGRTMRRNVERALVKNSNAQALRVAFSASKPEDENAAIALAQAHMLAGDKSSARAVLSPIWRNEKLTPAKERSILKNLGGALTKADHRARVEYLLSRKRVKGAERIAGLAGMKRLVSARAAVVRKQKSALKKLKAVPNAQQKEANFALSKARLLRRADKPAQAAKVLLSVKSKSIHPNAADELWKEQRIIASDLLEAGHSKKAYRLAARNIARSDAKRIDAEFYAGWIALRKLNKPKKAERHFQKILKIAGTPLSKSRGHYWLGRALAAAKNPNGANEEFKKAARFDTTYYGQLASSKLGKKSIRVSKARPAPIERDRFMKYELVQAIAKLESAGHPKRARMIYRFLAKHLNEPGELALLAARAERNKDYQLSLQVGKTGFIRGFDVDNLAWPIGAIPKSTQTSGAGLPLAYAIARQESTFQVDARSSANALGLLQLLPSTAKRTAKSIGVKYSRNKLVSDASYNARLGTAYLAQQMERFGGSYILTFSAYNAGPLRAKEWIERYGDPRGKSLETVVDWVESIPYSETRNYVQRVMENYQVYKRRIKGSPLTIVKDLRRGKRI